MSEMRGEQRWLREGEEGAVPRWCHWWCTGQSLLSRRWCSGSERRVRGGRAGGGVEGWEEGETSRAREGEGRTCDGPGSGCKAAQPASQELLPEP